MSNTYEENPTPAIAAALLAFIVGLIAWQAVVEGPKFDRQKDRERRNEAAWNNGLERFEESQKIAGLVITLSYDPGQFDGWAKYNNTLGETCVAPLVVSDEGWKSINDPASGEPFPDDLTIYRSLEECE